MSELETETRDVIAYVVRQSKAGEPVKLSGHEVKALEGLLNAKSVEQPSGLQKMLGLRKPPSAIELGLIAALVMVGFTSCQSAMQTSDSIDDMFKAVESGIEEAESLEKTSPEAKP